jgi:hypothetical protein
MRPVGSIKLRMGSAMARPPRMPGLKLSISATARIAESGTIDGLECTSTKTTGVVPADTSACLSGFCGKMAIQVWHRPFN